MGSIGTGASTATGTSNSSTTETSTRSITPRQLLTLPTGSKIEVQSFSAITGKPTGNYKEFTLTNGRWSSRDGEAFDNELVSLRQLNSINGTTPDIRYIKRRK